MGMRVDQARNAEVSGRKDSSARAGRASVSRSQSRGRDIGMRTVYQVDVRRLEIGHSPRAKTRVGGKTGDTRPSVPGLFRRRDASLASARVPAWWGWQ